MTVSEYDYLLDKALRDPGSPQLITELIRRLEREYEFTPEQAGAKIADTIPTTIILMIIIHSFNVIIIE